MGSFCLLNRIILIWVACEPTKISRSRLKPKIIQRLLFSLPLFEMDGTRVAEKPYCELFAWQIRRKWSAMEFLSRSPKVQICHHHVKKPVILPNRENKKLIKRRPRQGIQKKRWSGKKTVKRLWRHCFNYLQANRNTGTMDKHLCLLPVPFYVF